MLVFCTGLSGACDYPNTKWGREGNKQIETDHPPVPLSTVLMTGLDLVTSPIFKGKIKVTLKD